MPHNCFRCCRWPLPPPLPAATQPLTEAALPGCCSVEHKMRKGVSVRDVYKIGKTIGTGGAPRGRLPAASDRACCRCA